MLICIGMLSVVEKALLVELYYKNSESAIAAMQAYHFMRDMPGEKGPITSSALNKMIKQFGATGCLASCPISGRPSEAATVATTVEFRAQSKISLSL